MKTGTICSKHEKIISIAEKIKNKILSEDWEITGSIDSENIETLQKRLKNIQAFLAEVVDYCKDIDDLAINCLEDGQAMEAGLEKKKKIIEEIEEDHKRLEDQIYDLENKDD